MNFVTGIFSAVSNFDPETATDGLFDLLGFNSGEITKESDDVVTLDISVQHVLQTFDHDRANSYPTHSIRRGAALVINEIHFTKSSDFRRGASADSKNLKNLFDKMGLDVTVYEDLKKNDLMEKVTEFRDSLSDKHYDMLFVFVMSHGEMKGKTTYIRTSDRRKLDVSWISDQFSNGNCSGMAGKPKIMFYQCCRGKETDIKRIKPNRNISYLTEPTEMEYHDKDVYETVSNKGDMLVVYVTMPGYLSFRNSRTGTTYITTFCKILASDAKDTHIIHLLRKISNTAFEDPITRRDGCSLQRTNYECLDFMRDCFIHPKVYWCNEANCVQLMPQFENRC